MNDSEKAARPYLDTIARHRRRTLYKEAQVALATWATKTAYALQLALPDAEPLPPGVEAIPTDHYRQLAQLKTEPPKGVQVWIAAYQGHRHTFFQPRALHLTGETTGTVHHGYFPTVLIGSAMFQVFGSTNDEPVTITKGRAAADMATQIWPILGDVQYPPKLVVTEASLDAFLTMDFPPPRH